MKLVYLRTDFPNCRSRILLRNIDSDNNPQLHHYILVLSNIGELWVDIFWPHDEDSEKYTTSLSEQQFWRIFREWRLHGITLGDNNRVAEILAKKELEKKRRFIKKI